MLQRVPLLLLLVVQALGGGAITLAHARDVVAAPRGVEASHNGRCAILHDQLRCALCHYASARVVRQETFVFVTPAKAILLPPIEPTAAAASVTHITAPPRAPPSSLS